MAEQRITCGRWPALIALACLTAGCSQTHSTLPAARHAGGRPAAPAATVALPFPGDRGASGLTETILLGKDTELRSSGATEVGTALLLDAGAEPAGVAFAVYRFNTSTSTTPDSVSVALEPGSASGAWVGLADYARLRWEFYGPYMATKTLVLDDPKYVSLAGNVRIAIIAYGGAAQVNALSVRTLYPNNIAPSALLSADPLTGQAPLTVNFDGIDSFDPDGTIIEYAWDFDGNGTYEEFTDSPLAPHVFTAGGQFTVTLRVTDDQFARDTSQVDISVSVPPGNEPPQVDLYFNPQGGGSAPMTITLTAYADDPDGSIERYDWDWEGDGLYEAFSEIPSVTHVYDTDGLHNPRVRVTDDVGATATDDVSYDVAIGPVWQRILPGPGWGHTPNGPSGLALVNGRPAVAFAEGRIYYNRALDATGTSWNAPQMVGTEFGYFPSLAVVAGKPALVYYQQNTGELHYLPSLDSDGTTWGTPVAIGPKNVGNVTRLYEVNGVPAIVYDWGVGTHSAYFARATDSTGATWMTPVKLTAGTYVSLCMVNGQPAVAYGTEGGGPGISYCRALDALGDSWPAPTFLQGGANPSLAVVDGFPAIGCRFVGGASSGLAFIRALDADGIAWAAPQQVSSGQQLSSVGLAVINGLPVLVGKSYDYPSSQHIQYYCKALAPDGSSWGASLLASRGINTNLLDVGGQGVASFCDGAMVGNTLGFALLP